MISRIRRTWRHRIGFRGAALLGFAIFDLMYGWTRLIHPDPVSARSQQMAIIGGLFPWIPTHTTILTWGLLWWAAGGICLINAFRSDDRWGFGAAIGIKISWLLANGWAWANGMVGGGATVFLWALVLYFAVIFAILPEPIPELDKFLDEHTGEIPKQEDGGPDAPERS